MKNGHSPHRKLYFLLALFLAALLLYILFGIFWEKPNGEIQEDSPGIVREILGQEESCMNCHAGMTGFAEAHNPDHLGCTPCHLGNPYAEEIEAAHAGMVLVPGNLSDVNQTCGTLNCHHDLATRVEHSLMTTMAGVVNVDRFVFGESDTLTAFAHVEELGHTAADLHLRHLCASCHLGNEKRQPAPIGERSRGGGCNACHLNYSPEALKQLHAYYPEKKEGKFPNVHPTLNLTITNDHCFGCHSRSGRISLNYEGWHETQLSIDDQPIGDDFRHLEDHRVLTFIAADVHHQAGMACIDCHTATEVMGDGNIYLHEEDAVKVQCSHCHFKEAPATVAYDALDLESRKILALRKIEFEGMTFLHDPESGQSYLNGLVNEEGKALLVGKNDGIRRPLNPPADICTRGNAHDELSCASCHTAWAPQCIGCHNRFDPEGTAYDLLDKKRTRGKWEEYVGIFLAEPPTLGVVQTKDPEGNTWRTIRPFLPGMILTIDHTEAPGSAARKEGSTFHRLFAPAAPHTIAKAGRSCQSCHNNPLAIGYGRGTLTFQQEGNTGRWHFEPEYAATPEDGLPQDAWIGFLEGGRSPSATRPNARPFSVAEQYRILEVGACLTCHADQSNVMLEALEDFEGTRARRSEKCVVLTK